MRIHTHHHEESDPPWMALDMDAACEVLSGYPLTDEEKNNIGEIMAGYCVLIDDDGLIGYGETEKEAIENTLKKL